MYEYKARVIKVHDGDTIWLDIDLGMDIHNHQSVRLHGVNTPELSTEDGKQVKEYVQNLLPVGAVVLLNTIKDRREKYGRYLGVIHVNGINVNESLVGMGYAATY